MSLLKRVKGLEATVGGPRDSVLITVRKRPGESTEQACKRTLADRGVPADVPVRYIVIPERLPAGAGVLH